MEPNGYVKYLIVVKGLTTDRCLTATYFHNLMGCYWYVEGYHFPYANLHSFEIVEMVEMERSPELQGIVFTH